MPPTTNASHNSLSNVHCCSEIWSGGGALHVVQGILRGSRSIVEGPRGGGEGRGEGPLAVSVQFSFAVFYIFLMCLHIGRNLSKLNYLFVITIGIAKFNIHS